jgi:periplasmic divalent cation tolerance protein
MDLPAPIIVLTTWPAATDPSALAATLVAERLAACVNVLPEMASVYAWRGAVERDRERQILMKTTTARLEALQRRLTELHPYEVPEFLVLPLAGGSRAYLEWLHSATETPPAAPQS